MKVLQPRVAFKNESEITCPHCRAVLAFTDEEVYPTFDQTDLVKIDLGWVECPECGNCISVWRHQGEKKYRFCPDGTKTQIKKAIEEYKIQRGIIP